VWNDGDLSKLDVSFRGHQIVRSGRFADLSSTTFYSPSRPLLEFHVRQRVLALANVMILQGHDVLEPTCTPGRDHITGVRIANRQSGAEEVLDADLVVDAMGRGSRPNVGRVQGSAASVQRPSQNTILPARPHSILGRVTSRCAMPVLAYGSSPEFQPGPRLERRTACTWRIRIRLLIYSRPAGLRCSHSLRDSASRSRSYFGAVYARWRGSLIAYVLVDDTGTHVCHFGALSEAIDDERVEAFVVLNGYVDKEVLAARDDK
jgi:hypothetical protein